jgi:hypothetical protein
VLSSRLPLNSGSERHTRSRDPVIKTPFRHSKNTLTYCCERVLMMSDT